MFLDVIHEDDQIVVINKPNNLAIHRSKLVRNTKEFAVDIIRKQTDRILNPVHRLDRKTSGIMVFSDCQDTLNALRVQFEDRLIQKTYLAIVRGYIDDEGIVEKPLLNDKGQLQEAITNYECLEKTELNIPLGPHPTSRYSLVRLYPKTGRQHQLRKHLNHLRHPIIGDRPHGCNKQNRFFKQNWGIENMMLHAREISFEHPATKKKMTLRAPLSSSFMHCTETLNFTKTDF